MDFPSREEARQHIQLLARGGAPVRTPATPPPDPDPAESTGGFSSPEATAAERVRFRVEKPGYQSDVFDRKGLRNLIRTREILETDRIRVDLSEPVPAGDLPYLKSLFSLAKAQKIQPPACCGTHTD